MKTPDFEKLLPESFEWKCPWCDAENCSDEYNDTWCEVCDKPVALELGYPEKIGQ